MTQTLVAAFFFIIMQTVPAFASIEIVAKVNGKPITNYEVSQRVSFLTAVTNIKLDDSNLQRIEKDALQMLIDEKLKLEAAKKIDPDIANRSLPLARDLIDRSFQHNGKTGVEILNDLNLDSALIQRKFITDVVWASFIQTRFGDKLGDIEAKIDTELDRIKKNTQQPQIRLSELVLVPEPDRPLQETIALAREIVTVVSKGANFNAIAQQYSVSGSAQNGGRIGWVFTDQLPTDVITALAGTDIGSVTQPVLQDGAVFIFKKDGERKSGLMDPSQDRVWLTRAILPVLNGAPNADRLEAAARLERDSVSISSCPDLLKLHARYGSNMQGSLDNMIVASLAPQMLTLVSNLRPGMVSAPLSFREGIAVFMLCKRDKAKIDLPSRKDLERKIVEKFFGSLGERYLLRLRRAAMIERL